MSDKYSSEDIRSLMERRSGVYPEFVDQETLRKSGCMNTVCVLPSEFNDRFSYLADVLVQMMGKASCDGDLRLRIGRLCEALSYMSNSMSWRDGELYDFDRIELERKLSMFASMNTNNHEARKPKS